MSTHTADPTTAERLRAEAAQHDQDAHDSFERCDTDGFLSQAASGLNAMLMRARADIAEDDGLALFARTVLVKLDGTETDARAVDTRYGRKWRLDSTDEWLPYMPVRESTLAKYGYREIELEEIGPAAAMHDAPRGARGTGGMCSVYVRVFRTDKDRSEGWRHVGRVA